MNTFGNPTFHHLKCSFNDALFTELLTWCRPVILEMRCWKTCLWKHAASDDLRVVLSYFVIITDKILYFHVQKSAFFKFIFILYFTYICIFISWCWSRFKVLITYMTISELWYTNLLYCPTSYIFLWICIACAHDNRCTNFFNKVFF